MGSPDDKNREGPSAPPARAKARADAPDVAERVHAELPLVTAIARQVVRQLGGKIMFDELASFGREGLLEAARSYDPALGIPFHRWAGYRIRGAILDGVRSTSMLPRSVYARLRAIDSGQRAAEAASEEGSARAPGSVEEADARLGSYLAGIATAVAVGFLASAADGKSGEGVDPSPPADDVMARTEMLAQVRDAMASLPEQERHLVQRHYFDDVQLDEAAKEIGLSKSWGSRLHGRAIESITLRLRRSQPPR